MRTVCLDLEASSLGRSGFPIEVAAATVEDGSVSSWLIAPPPLWLDRGAWDDDAEALHKLSLRQLETEGQSPAVVVDGLDRLLSGANILSDNPAHDGAWLQALYGAAFALVPVPQVRSFQAFALLLAPSMQAIADAEAEALALFPTLHRAGPDASRLAYTLRVLDGATASDKPDGLPILHN